MYIDKDYFLTKQKESYLEFLTSNDDNNLSTAIEDAMDVVDSFLRAFYVVPLNPAPRIIQLATYSIALHILYGRVNANEIPQSVQDNYLQQIELLKLIAKGSIVIGSPKLADITEEQVGNSGRIFANSQPNYFNGGSF